MRPLIQTVMKGFLISIYFCFSFISCTTEDKNQQLPQVNLNLDLNKVNIGDYIDASISYRNKNSSVNTLPIKIKYRGNASAHHPKKNFSFKLSQKICFIESQCHKRWKLNAEYIDKTFMRNKLSYDLYRRFSLTNIAPKIDYVQVNLNSNYEGIYTLTEKVDDDLLRFIKHDTNAVLFKEAPISFPSNEHKKRHADFIAYSNWAEFYKDFSDKSMKKLIERVYYNQRFPKIDKSNKAYLIHDITWFIFSSTDTEFKSEKTFNSYFDIQNLIDWHLLLLTTNNGDGLIKNFYLYRQGTNQPFKICPWDYDHSFGRDGDGELNLNEFISLEQIGIINRLLTTNAFNYRKLLLDKYLHLKKNDILTKNNIHNMIDQNVTALKPYIGRNEEKWPLDSIPFFEKKSDFFSEVTLIKNWVEKRLPELEEYLLRLQLSSTIKK